MMEIYNYFNELIVDYNQCYLQQFTLDIRLVEECIVVLENHYFVLNALLSNVDNELKDKLENLRNIIWSLYSRLETLFQGKYTN